MVKECMRTLRIVAFNLSIRKAEAGRKEKRKNK